MIDMIKQHVAPSGKAAGLSVDQILMSAEKIMGALETVHHAGSLSEGAALARTLRLETMVEVRKLCDELEGKVPSELWTLATYKELLFMDMQPLDHTPQGYSSAVP